MNAARRGEGEVGAVPDSDLFFIDTAEQADGDTEVVRRKSRDASTAPTTRHMKAPSRIPFIPWLR